MASPPEPEPDAGGLTDYERRRAENIRRNGVILDSLRRKAAELSAIIQLSRPPTKKQQPRARPRAAPAVVRRSLRTQGLPPPPASGPAPAPPRRSTRITPSLASAILDATSPPASEAKVRDDGFDARTELVLRPSNVRRLVSADRIPSLRILPLVDRTVVAAGSNVGHVGFWVVDDDGDDAHRVFEYMPHLSSVGAIVAHAAKPHKIYSCSHGGEICLMDLERENFNITRLSEFPILSLCQAPNSPSCLYFGEETDVKLFDDRIGKVSTSWNAHASRINSIDFHPENTYMLATSSRDGTACMWDLRTMKKKGAESLVVLEHDRGLQSAYFSPSGHMVATTSLDGIVRVFSVDNFENFHTVERNNNIGTHLSTFKAIWGWNDMDLFIGNATRAIDVISVDLNDSSISTTNNACLKSEHMVSIPYRFSAHPCKVGHLACSSSSGKVFLWTRA
ncbi:uncharacterized protein [Oryza sativa Japonica Group]|nr:WD repeat-containing protein 76 [Oryza sativa Japonica Group]KAF2918994.1 hypothetical protein DAI22_08g101800 [Oryza sativa Japonica Group]BAG99532.1 unnamed protein product [Oryza sativa Japonica Group]